MLTLEGPTRKLFQSKDLSSILMSNLTIYISSECYVKSKRNDLEIN